MRNIYFIIVVLILGLYLSACNSTNPDTTPIATKYAFSKINCYVRYIEQKKELQAEMTFRSDSTKTIQGKVSVNEEAMIFKSLPSVGFQYRLIKTMPKIDSIYVFKYTEKDGSEASMSIGLSRFENFRVASKGISQKAGGILEWEGEPLTKEDGLVLIFTDVEGNTFSVNHAGVSKGSQFEVLGEHSSRLAVGKATLHVTRKRTILTEEDGKIKLLTLEYYLKPIEFQVNK